jgi:adenylate cyclase class 2
LTESTTAAPPLRNIELKAVCRDLPAARAAALRLDPPVRNDGVRRQIDTYFLVPNGRLKLRETDRASELIWYDRPDEAATRRSDYRLTPISHPSELKASLTAAVRVRGVVDKTREVLLWHNVRIHLDQVAGLGSFVEFEAVIGPGDDEETGHVRIAELCTAMSIARADHLETSYCDLLMNCAGVPPVSGGLARSEENCPQ